MDLLYLKLRFEQFTFNMSEHLDEYQTLQKKFDMDQIDLYK